HRHGAPGRETRAGPPSTEAGSRGMASISRGLARASAVVTPGTVGPSRSALGRFLGAAAALRPVGGSTAGGGPIGGLGGHIPVGRGRVVAVSVPIAVAAVVGGSVENGPDERCAHLAEKRDGPLKLLPGGGPGRYHDDG